MGVRKQDELVLLKIQMAEDSQIVQFLSNAELNPASNRFTLITREKGITVYKQQMRALNLLYTIRSANRVKRGEKVAIIGAGVAGITAAAAGFILGYKVHLFEKSPILCHLQQGCEIRWIHPHLYDWPRHGSERLYAGLPFLNWKASTASEVVEQLTREFDTMLRWKPENLTFTPGVNLSFPSPKRIRWDGADRGEEDFAAIIFAIGFGIERRIEEFGSQSYWRNDSLNQPEAGGSRRSKMVVFISGTGDGGFIDLIRATLHGYNQGRIVQELFHNETTLVNELRRVVETWDDVSKDLPKTWLYDQYSDLFNRNLLKRVLARIRPRVRQDTEAILNGRQARFALALALDKGSILNTLLVFLLHKLKAFKYESGECGRITDKFAYVEGRKIKAERFIVRHGPDTLSVCKIAKFNEGIKLFRDPESEKTFDTSLRLWPAGWWGERTQIYLGKQRLEFVHPTTTTIANTFVSTLSDIIKLKHKKRNPNFRMTLHRIVRVNEQEYYQQISRYAGTRSGGGVGRVFDVKTGMVGLSCRIGKPITVVRDKYFKKIWKLLRLYDFDAHEINRAVRSLLACPFFAPREPGQRTRYTSLVLFMDSAEPDFFTDDVLELVYGACKGFVENVEEMGRTNEVHFVASDFPGYRVRQSKRDRAIVEEYASVDAENKVFKHFQKDLTFKKVASFNTDSDVLYTPSSNA